MEPFNFDEAQAHVKLILACDKKHQCELRKHLVTALQRKSNEALKLGSVAKYLTYLSQKSDSISVSYLRRIKKAGLVELGLFGEESVGNMPEGALRVLSENVKSADIEKVYDEATSLTNRVYPTAKLLKETAIKLGVFHERKRKKQPLDKNTSEAETDMTSEKATTVNTVDANNSTCPKVKKLPPLKKATKLVQRLGSADAYILKTMLEGALNNKIYKAYTGIRKSYEKQDWTKIAKGIDRNIGNAPN